MGVNLLLLIAHVNTSLEENLFILVKALQNLRHIGNGRTELDGCLSDRDLRRFVINFGLDVDQRSRLNRNDVEEVLSCLLNNLDLVHDLVKENAIFFDSTPVHLHDLG